jgi:hypothetical protein
LLEITIYTHGCVDASRGWGGRAKRIEKKKELNLSSQFKHLKIPPKNRDHLIWPTCFIGYRM